MVLIQRTGSLLPKLRSEGNPFILDDLYVAGLGEGRTSEVGAKRAHRDRLQACLLLENPARHVVVESASHIDDAVQYSFVVGATVASIEAVSRVKFS
jgi:hypothetical protein